MLAHSVGKTRIGVSGFGLAARADHCFRNGPLFIDGGLRTRSKLAIVGTKLQLKSAREILRLTLFPPTKNEFTSWGGKPRLYDMLTRAGKVFAIGSSVDELVDFVPYEADSAAQIGAFRIVKADTDTFLVSMGDEKAQLVELDCRHVPEAPYEIAPEETVHTPYGFAVRVLSYSNGFDPKHGCTALVIWLNGVPYLWDAAPYVSQSLMRYGLSMRQLGGIFLSHVHEDHSSLLELFYTGQKVRVYSTNEIFESMIIKLGHQVGLDASSSEVRKRLKESFDFRAVECGVPVHISGAKVHFHWTVHTIPTIGARFEFENGGSHSLLLTSDTVGPKKLAELHASGVVSTTWYEQLSTLVRGDEDLVIYDGGADGAELHPNPGIDDELRKQALSMEGRMVFGHRSAPIAYAPELRVVQPGDLFELWDAQLEHDDLGALEVAFEQLGIRDRLELRSVWNQRKEVIEAPPATAVVTQGDPAEDFYVVLNGRLAVEQDGNRIATLGEGDFFGEMAVLGNGVRAATVRALSAVRLLVLPKHVLVRLVEGCDLEKRLKNIWDNRPCLMEVDLFRSLPTRGLNALAGVGKRKSFAAGEPLLLEGSRGTEFFVVEKGEVTVRRQGAELAVLGAGSVVGEHGAYFPGSTRTATVTAKTPSTAIAIPGAKLRAVAHKFLGMQTELRLTLKHRGLNHPNSVFGEQL